MEKSRLLSDRAIGYRNSQDPSILGLCQRREPPRCLSQFRIARVPAEATYVWVLQAAHGKRRAVMSGAKAVAGALSVVRCVSYREPDSRHWLNGPGNRAVSVESRPNQR